MSIASLQSSQHVWEQEDLPFISEAQEAPGSLPCMWPFQDPGEYMSIYEFIILCSPALIYRFHMINSSKLKKYYHLSWFLCLLSMQFQLLAPSYLTPANHTNGCSHHSSYTHYVGFLVPFYLLQLHCICSSYNMFSEIEIWSYYHTNNYPFDF